MNTGFKWHPGPTWYTRCPHSPWPGLALQLAGQGHHTAEAGPQLLAVWYIKLQQSSKLLPGLTEPCGAWGMGQTELEGTVAPHVCSRGLSRPRVLSWPWVDILGKTLRLAWQRACKCLAAVEPSCLFKVDNTHLFNTWVPQANSNEGTVGNVVTSEPGLTWWRDCGQSAMVSLGPVVHEAECPLGGSLSSWACLAHQGRGPSTWSQDPGPEQTAGAHLLNKNQLIT